MAHDSVIIEADGGSRGNPGPAGFGALLRDATTGEVIAEAAESIGRATNNVAEYRGLIAGLELYLEHTPTALLEVRMDSKLVVEQMAGRWKVKHPDMPPLASRAHGLAPFGTVWTWVPRERNGDADRLANLAMDAAARGETVDLTSGPSPALSTAPVPEDHDLRASSGDPAPDPMEPTAPVTVAAADSEAEADDDGKADADADGGPLRRAGSSRHALLGWSDGLGEETTLVLLRHGVTWHTAERRFSGPGGDDPGLLDDGWQQARRAATVLARGGSIDAIVASPLRRTLDTAAAVSAELGLEVAVEEGFREAGFGAWDGYTVGEVEQRWPDELQAWLGSMAYAPPGGEAIVDVQKRVEEALVRTIAAYPGKRVLVVSHVTPIKLTVRYCLDAPLQIIHKLYLAPASLTTVSFYASGASALRQFSAVP